MGGNPLPVSEGDIEKLPREAVRFSPAMQAKIDAGQFNERQVRNHTHAFLQKLIGYRKELIKAMAPRIDANGNLPEDFDIGTLPAFRPGRLRGGIDFNARIEVHGRDTPLAYLITTDHGHFFGYEAQRHAMQDIATYKLLSELAKRGTDITEACKNFNTADAMIYSGRTAIFEVPGPKTAALLIANGANPNVFASMTGALSGATVMHKFALWGSSHLADTYVMRDNAVLTALAELGASFVRPDARGRQVLDYFDSEVPRHIRDFRNVPALRKEAIQAKVDKGTMLYQQLRYSDDPAAWRSLDRSHLCALAVVDKHGEAFSQDYWREQPEEAQAKLQTLPPFLQDEILQMQPWVARAVSQRETPTQSWAARVAAEPTREVARQW
jgi:hypothetical protein